VRELEEEYLSPKEIPGLIERLRKEMKEAASRLEFERAAELRDRIKRLQEILLTHDLPQ